MAKLSLVGENPPKGLDELRDWLAQFSKDVTTQINGNILFGDNIKCSILDVSFPVAVTDVSVRHNLAKVPTGYWLILTNAPTSIYTGSVAANTQTITLQATAIATTKVLVF